MAADNGRGFKDLAVVVLDRARHREASEAAADIRSFDRARLEATRGPKGLLLRAGDPPPFGLLVFVRTPRGAGVRIGSSCETVSSIPADGRHNLRIGNTACSITWD